MLLNFLLKLTFIICGYSSPMRTEANPSEQRRTRANKGRASEREACEAGEARIKARNRLSGSMVMMSN